MRPRRAEHCTNADYANGPTKGNPMQTTEASFLEAAHERHQPGSLKQSEEPQAATQENKVEG